MIAVATTSAHDLARAVFSRRWRRIVVVIARVAVIVVVHIFLPRGVALSRVGKRYPARQRDLPATAKLVVSLAVELPQLFFLLRLETGALVRAAGAARLEFKLLLLLEVFDLGVKIAADAVAGVAQARRGENLHRKGHEHQQDEGTKASAGPLPGHSTCLLGCFH
jgi:hypothetical protein